MTGYPLVISEEVKEEKNVLIQTYALSYNSEVLVSFFVVVESVSSIYFLKIQIPLLFAVKEILFFGWRCLD